MVIKMNNLTEFVYMNLPCGSRAFYDVESSFYSFRCESCMAVVGSIGQPKSCKERMNQYDVWNKLGGVGWDYSLKSITEY